MEVDAFDRSSIGTAKVTFSPETFGMPDMNTMLHGTGSRGGGRGCEHKRPVG